MGFLFWLMNILVVGAVTVNELKCPFGVFETSSPEGSRSVTHHA